MKYIFKIITIKGDLEDGDVINISDDLNKCIILDRITKITNTEEVILQSKTRQKIDKPKWATFISVLVPIREE